MPQLPRAAICGTGSYAPSKVMTNADFEKVIDTSDEWIVQRTGIKERRVMVEGETTSSMALAAAKAALADAKMEAKDLDLIVCGTVTGDMLFPSTACFVQQGLGVTDIPVFDVSAACSGFLYALSVGSQFIQAGTYRKVLVIGADALSRYTDYTDRGSCILFGDGAGAVVLEATMEDKGVLYSVMRADGAGWDYINVPGGGTRHPASAQTVADGLHFVKMKGRDVYKFAIEKMQWLLGDCMEKCQLTVETVDMVVPHQVNLRIIDSAAKKYGFPMEKIYINIERYGNTSAASIPLALDEARRGHFIGPGSTIIMVAFGAGLTWAGAVVKL
ncbi:MAG: beta-ketoacyl-ACP synthase III [Planctomycetota bacterium]|jgi:3-oxoacyl-[acyl-carrier-protein] synthase-3